MRAIYKAPGEAPVIRDISDTRTGLKELLGGSIVTSHFSTDACIIMREGASKLPYNFNFCGYAVHGPALFVATSGRKFTELSPTATDLLLGLLEPTEKEPCK